MKKRNYSILNKFIALLSLFFISFAFMPVAYAASLTAISDNMTRQKISVDSDHTIRFTTPTGAGDVGDTIAITFPSDFSTTTVDFSDIDLSYGPSTGAETNAVLAAAADATSWGAAFGGTGSRTLTFTHPTNGTNGDIAASDKVIVKIGLVASGGDQAINNPTVKGTYVVTIDGTFGDTGRFAVSIPESSGDDQIPVSATVNPTITFTVINTAFDLGDLSSSGIVTSGLNNVSVGTNAPAGYSIKIQDTGNPTGTGNDGLYSTGASNLIASGTATLAAGTEGYGGQCAVTAGSGACGFALTSGGEAVTGFVDDGTWPTFASYGSKPAATDTYQIRVKAAISTSTTSGYYTDILTLVATGNF